MRTAGLLKPFQELQAYNRNTWDNQKYFMENNILKDVAISNFLCIFFNFLLQQQGDAIQLQRRSSVNYVYTLSNNCEKHQEPPRLDRPLNMVWNPLPLTVIKSLTRGEFWKLPGNLL